MSIMGPYIVLAVGFPPAVTGIDILLLVDWQEGHVIEVSQGQMNLQIADISPKLRRTKMRTYLTDFLVLSDDALALVQGPGNAIELCRISTTPTVSLQTIHHLGLPPLLPDVRLVASSLKTEDNPTTLDSHRHSRPPPRHPFFPLQVDSLVLLSLSVRIPSSSFVCMRTYTLVMHARTLLSYASSTSSPHTPNLIVPWDAWGPQATRCFDGHSGATSAVAMCQRWFKCGTIRDFCQSRVRAAGGGFTPRSTLLASGAFTHDIESALPYHEVQVVLENNNDLLVDDALIDKERVMFIVPRVRSFYLESDL
jgi:hypothetical protein